MRYKKQISSALLSIVIVSLFCTIPASASRLYISNHIIGDGADPDKEFEYYSRMVYHCTVCDAPFPNFSEYSEHRGIGFSGAHGGGGSWYTLDDTRKVTRKNSKIGTIDSLGTGTHNRDAYIIQLLEPDIDQYDVYYQVNDGPIQSVPIQRVNDWTDLSKYGFTSGDFPAVYIKGLPTDITKTYLTFYYLLPGASVSDIPSNSDMPDTPKKPTLKPGAADNDPTLAADALYAMGLFCGTGMDANGQPIYDLNRAPTRSEAVTMLVRLLGKEEEAKFGTWVTPFADVEQWAEPYVGYAYHNGLVAGTSSTTFGGSETVTASQYITFVLRALGYESGTDFAWDKAWELSDQIGLPGRQYSAGTTKFTRGDVAAISFNALYCKLKGSDTTLIDKL